MMKKLSHELIQFVEIILLLFYFYRNLIYSSILLLSRSNFKMAVNARLKVSSKMIIMTGKLLADLRHWCLRIMSIKTVKNGRLRKITNSIKTEVSLVKRLALTLRLGTSLIWYFSNDSHRSRISVIATDWFMNSKCSNCKTTFTVSLHLLIGLQEFIYDYGVLIQPHKNHTCAQNLYH